MFQTFVAETEEILYKSTTHFAEFNDPVLSQATEICYFSLKFLTLGSTTGQNNLQRIEIYR